MCPQRLFFWYELIFLDLIGESTETGTTFFTKAERNVSDGLFYFKDFASVKISTINEGFSLLKFTQPGRKL